MHAKLFRFRSLFYFVSFFPFPSQEKAVDFSKFDLVVTGDPSKHLDLFEVSGHGLSDGISGALELFFEILWQ